MSSWPKLWWLAREEVSKGLCKARLRARGALQNGPSHCRRRSESLRAPRLQQPQGKRRRSTYRSVWGPPAMASPRELFPEPEPADEVATATSGKVWRKLAINSSPGFWDDVLRATRLASLSIRHNPQPHHISQWNMAAHAASSWKPCAHVAAPVGEGTYRFRNIWMEAELGAAHSFKVDSSGALGFSMGRDTQDGGSRSRWKVVVRIM